MVRAAGPLQHAAAFDSALGKDVAEAVPGSTRHFFQVWAASREPFILEYMTQPASHFLYFGQFDYC